MIEMWMDGEVQQLERFVAVRRQGVPSARAGPGISSPARRTGRQASHESRCAGSGAAANAVDGGWDEENVRLLDRFPEEVD